MLDRTDIAYIAEDDAGNLQLVVLGVCCGVKTVQIMICATEDDHAGIDDTAVFHKLFVFIEY